MTVRGNSLMGWALGACLVAMSAVAYAQQGPSTGSGQAYSNRTVRFIVPLAPGC